VFILFCLKRLFGLEKKFTPLLPVVPCVSKVFCCRLLFGLDSNNIPLLPTAVPFVVIMLSVKLLFELLCIRIP